MHIANEETSFWYWDQFYDNLYLQLQGATPTAGARKSSWEAAPPAREEPLWAGLYTQLVQQKARVRHSVQGIIKPAAQLRSSPEAGLALYWGTGKCTWCHDWGLQHTAYVQARWKLHSDWTGIFELQLHCFHGHVFMWDIS